MKHPGWWGWVAVAGGRAGQDGWAWAIALTTPPPFWTTLQLAWNRPLISLGGQPVSLRLILLLTLYAVILGFLARWFRKLLRDRLLVGLRIDEGNRGAIASILSYSLAVILFLLLLQSSGFSLYSLAVPAGALGVGVGLGLQNITKNFVSGTSLLVERKIRVGDFVEFGDRAGHVKEIALRATVIRTLDGANVVVPNSELVEQAVINWHYDNLAARLHIPVGVAYGSDPLLVTETLLNAAYAEPAVLSDPPPSVLFTGFGDSALNFELRVWVHGYELEPDLRSSLNYNIEYHLRQQHIAIPFPQQDLWLRNPESLLPVLHPRPTPDLLLTPNSASSDHRPHRRSLQESLRQITYFAEFSELEFRRLIECGYRHRLKAGEILFREGDPGNAFHIILAGTVEVFVEKMDKHLTQLEAGDFFGELSLMLGIPRTATVRACQETTLFTVNHKGFKQLLHTYPHVSEVIIQTLASRQSELAARQAELRRLGLMQDTEDDSNPVVWMRRRVCNLFGLEKLL
jgi:small-conductance mechanosensitive channel